MRKPIIMIQAEVRAEGVEVTWYKSTPAFERGEEEEFSHFRVLRTEESEFVFGGDYEEFFLGVRADGAEEVFCGPLAPHNNRRYAFLDRSARIGKTYCYFLQTKTSTPIGPVAVRVRDHEVWWPYEKIVERLERLRGHRPGAVQLSTCGRTAMGRDIPCVTVGSGPCLLALVGLVHAGESGPELIVPSLESLLDTQGRFLERCSVAAIPGLNLDSRERMVRGTPQYVRKNEQGIDLNRNFPASWEHVELGYGMDSSQADSACYRGPSPGSAPEVQAAMAFLAARRPACVLSYHWLSSLCGLPALASAQARADASYAARARHVVDAFGRALFPELESAEGWLGFACTSGSLATWLYSKSGCLAFDMEGGLGPSDGAAAKDLTDLATLADYQKRHAKALAALLAALAKDTHA